MGDNGAMIAATRTSQFRNGLALCALALVLAACASSGQKDAYRDTTYQYSAAVRWEGILAALPFIDPLIMAERPLSPLEISRYQQYRVTAYQLLSDTEDAQGQRIRRVQIGLVNLNTLTERVIRHQEIWRWDSAGKRWMLQSRPPSLSVEG